MIPVVVTNTTLERFDAFCRAIDGEGADQSNISSFGPCHSILLLTPNICFRLQQHHPELGHALEILLDQWEKHQP